MQQDTRPLLNQAGLLCNQSRMSIFITCPNCKQQGTTKVEYKSGSGTWCCCFILFIFIFLICWIPFVNKKCQDANHSCLNCGVLLGSCPYKVCG
ncbi:unnamed protein product [Paramecium sonneborni]|uniref:LITAF domain-containing protein n=1 Tax=Paramecium sonneborni TaxID=65129 RepID=A0A8S1R5F0_9CILI|nr:unnamed protein product [Paramecium sonneborni]CAD8121910.1 unnamed protein product [Paramecium sonneborni]